MKPHLDKHDVEMFYAYLKKINVYFEYGSGGSTYQASILHLFSFKTPIILG